MWSIGELISNTQVSVSSCPLMGFLNRGIATASSAVPFQHPMERNRARDDCGHRAHAHA
jgi:hypothetical protein